MITSLICIVILLSILAGIWYVGVTTGAYLRDMLEKLSNWHEKFDAEYSAETQFYANRKWEV